MTKHWLPPLLGAVAVCVGLFCAQNLGWTQTTLDAEAKTSLDKALNVIPGLTPDLIAGAQKEGTLTLYRTGYDFRGVVFPEFQKLFPYIKIVDFEATVGPLLQRYGAEARSGRNIADVVVNSIPGTVDAMDNEGLVAHYAPTSAAAYTSGQRDGAYYPFDRVLLCNAYNTNLVTEEQAAVLGTWPGIVDPRWRGKAGVLRLSTGGVSALTYYFVDEQKFTDFQTLLGKQEPLVMTSVPALIERLSAGGIEAAFFANDGNLHRLKRAGAPIRWKCPNPGLALNDFQFIAAKAPHPNAAKLWVEFILSTTGQRLVVDGLGLGPARDDVRDTRPVTTEPWYQAPTELYKYSWSVIDQRLDALRVKWDAAAANTRSGD